jgi:hypothetical protein
MESAASGAPGPDSMRAYTPGVRSFNVASWREDLPIECCIRHIKVIGEGEFLFGVEFEQFKDDGVKHFARFIDASLTPIERRSPVLPQA